MASNGNKKTKTPMQRLAVLELKVKAQGKSINQLKLRLDRLFESLSKLEDEHQSYL